MPPRSGRGGRGGSYPTPGLRPRGSVGRSVLLLGPDGGGRPVIGLLIPVVGLGFIGAVLLREGVEVPRLVEALEAVLTAVAEVGLSAEQEVAHGRRDEDGAVVGRLLDSSGEVDRGADDVAVFADLDL